MITRPVQATLEHLIDANPNPRTLAEHLETLQQAREQGVDAVSDYQEEKHRLDQLFDVLEGWIETETADDTAAFALDHADELLSPTVIEVVRSVGERYPDDVGLRVRRGLLEYAATAGIEAALELAADDNLRRVFLADLHAPAEERLAVARMHSGRSRDSPEAHFALAAIAMVMGNLAEAIAALSDCGEHAAPYERRAFGRRLTELAAEHSAEHLDELLPALNQPPVPPEY